MGRRRKGSFRHLEKTVKWAVEYRELSYRFISINALGWVDRRAQYFY